jgi:PIN domain nuclease of toxin-antitoxin system
VLLWWLAADASLPARARALIRAQENTIYVSAASAWEIATKFRLGKLPGAAALAPHFDDFLRQESFEPLPITPAHAIRAGLLTGPHKDPFDRMLIAQSQAENLPVVSSDSIFDKYKVHRLWR